MRSEYQSSTFTVLQCAARAFRLEVVALPRTVDDLRAVRAGVNRRAYVAVAVGYDS
jgi:hypothetical protein